MSSDTPDPSASGSSARDPHVLGPVSLGFSELGSFALHAPMPGSTRSGPATSGSVGSLRSGSSDDPAASKLRTVRADPLAVFRRIVPRDRALLARLAEHYLLSTPQITAAFFDSRRTAQRRLTTLHRLGVVHRFAYPNDEHTAVPYLYTLGPVGLQLHPDAYHDPDGRHTKAPRSSMELARRIAASATAAHLLGVNQFFVDLIAASRRPNVSSATGGARLVRWWSEQHASDVYAQSGIRPDGHGIWQAHDHTIGFFLEHDRGTEFSRGPGPCQSPDLHISAAQRLVLERYRPPRVWCKHSDGVSPVRVTGVGSQTTVHEGHCGCRWAGHGNSARPDRASVQGRGGLSRRFLGQATESATLRCWCPCRGAAWGRSGYRCRDRHPDRRPDDRESAAQGRSGGRVALLRKTLRGLSCRGGRHV